LNTIEKVWFQKETNLGFEKTSENQVFKQSDLGSS